MDVRRRFLGLQTNSSSGEDNIDSMYAAKYTTTNLQSITPYVTSPFDSEIVSHIFDPYSEEFGIVCERAITKINNDAFKNKSTLKTFIPSNTVTVIGSNAFYNCKSLTSITIPDKVTKVNTYAFYNCEALESVYCKPTTPPVGGTDMFRYNASNRKIYVPTASVNAYKTAKYWSDYADYIAGYDFEDL